MNAPTLREGDLRLEIERIFAGKNHHSKLVAFYGTGAPMTLSVLGREWRVIPTRCELELRRSLPAPGEVPAGGQVFLVDWSEDLPRDVRCRLVYGHMFKVSPSARLAGVFGARSADGDVTSSALGRLLLAEEIPGLKKVGSPRLTREDAWRRFLEATLRLPVSESLEAPALVRWALSGDGAAPLAHRGRQDPRWEAVRQEAAAFIRSESDALSALVWAASEAGQVERLVQIGVLGQAAILARDPFAQGVLWGRALALLPGLGAALDAARSTLTDDSFLAAALDSLEPNRRLHLLQDAEKLLSEGMVVGTWAHSPWLRAGLIAAETRLAESLDNALSARDIASMRAVTAALDEVERHHLNGLIRNGANELRRHGGRLVAWLVAREVRPPPTPHGAAWEPAIALATQFSEEGGWVDWARHDLQGPIPESEPLAGALGRVRAAADLAREQDNARFAPALCAWIEAGKPARHVLPIEQTLRVLASEVLEGGARRKLLVVLMDGMSQRDAVQILTRLEEQRRWGPIAWRPAGHRGARQLPPVLACAPTLTRVSRSAFFAGRASPRFGDEQTERDPERWAKNPNVAKWAADGASVGLFLKEGLINNGSLSAELQQAIAGSERMVGVVVNAIDDDLKGSEQIRKDYVQSRINALEALLVAAEGGERMVLLASDHGHVPGVGLRSEPERSRGREAGARCRGLRKGESATSGEIVLPDGTWRHPGFDAVAALWTESVTNQTPRAGGHGGVSLPEVVAPAYLLAPDWLHQVLLEEDRAELETRPLPRPLWWDLREPVPSRPAPQVTRTDPTVEPPRQQTLLPSLAPAPVPQPSVLVQSVQEPALHPLAQALQASAIFKEQVRSQPEVELRRVLGWLSALAEGPDALPADEFARRGGVRPHQVAAVVARMGVLNCDGFSIVEFNAAGRQVIFHRARLLQLYGIKA